MDTNFVPSRRTALLSHASSDIIASVSILDSSLLAKKGFPIIKAVVQPFFKDENRAKKSKHYTLEKQRVSVKKLPVQKINEIRFMNLFMGKKEISLYQKECWKRLKENFNKIIDFIKKNKRH